MAHIVPAFLDDVSDGSTSPVGGVAGEWYTVWRETP